MPDPWGSTLSRAGANYISGNEASTLGSSSMSPVYQGGLYYLDGTSNLLVKTVQDKVFENDSAKRCVCHIYKS